MPDPLPPALAALIDPTLPAHLHKGYFPEHAHGTIVATLHAIAVALSTQLAGQTTAATLVLGWADQLERGGQ